MADFENSKGTHMVSVSTTKTRVTAKESASPADERNLASDCVSSVEQSACQKSHMIDAHAQGRRKVARDAHRYSNGISPRTHVL